MLIDGGGGGSGGCGGGGGEQICPHTLALNDTGNVGGGLFAHSSETSRRGPSPSPFPPPPNPALRVVDERSLPWGLYRLMRKKML